MKTYVATIYVNCGLYTAIVIAKNRGTALHVLIDKLIKTEYLDDIKENEISLKELPLIPKENKEEVLYINGYEE